MPAVKHHQSRFNFPWCQTCTVQCRHLAANLPVQSTDLHGPPQVGFVFNLCDAAWEQSLEELRLVAEASGGVAHVLWTDPERPGLARWCAYQARRTSPARQLTEPGRNCTWKITKSGGISTGTNRDLPKAMSGAGSPFAVPACCARISVCWCSDSAGGGLFSAPAPHHAAELLPQKQRTLEKKGKLRADRKACLLKVLSTSGCVLIYPECVCESRFFFGTFTCPMRIPFSRFCRDPLYRGA